MTRKLLAIFAHPDDESIMMGGTLAFYAKQGVSVNLLCATRGEWGSISHPSLATQENLGAVREKELLTACEILGINFLGFLDCPDGNINNTDWTVIEQKIVRTIRILRPEIIVTFGLDGLYGHPDHIAISMLTKASFYSAAKEECFPQHFAENIQPFQSEKLYYTLYPDYLMRDLAANLNLPENQLLAWGFDADCFGVPFSEITTILDVCETINEKMKAIRAHRTQLDEKNIFANLDEPTAQKFLAKEYFRLVNREIGEKIETDLFESLDFVSKSANQFEI